MRIASEAKTRLVLCRHGRHPLIDCSKPQLFAEPGDGERAAFHVLDEALDDFIIEKLLLSARFELVGPL